MLGPSPCIRWRGLAFLRYRSLKATEEERVYHPSRHECRYIGLVRTLGEQQRPAHATAAAAAAKSGHSPVANGNCTIKVNEAIDVRSIDPGMERVVVRCEAECCLGSIMVQ